MGSQFDSPDGPASAKSLSDNSNSCALRFVDGGFGAGGMSSLDVSEDREETDGFFCMRFLPLPLPSLSFLPRVSSSVCVSLPNSANGLRRYVCDMVVGFTSCVTDSVLQQVFNDFKPGFNLNSCFAGKSWHFLL